MSLTRRQAARLALGGAVASLLAACQGAPGAPAAAPTTARSLVKPTPSGADLTAVQAASELAVGRDRFAIGLLDARNQPITAGAVQLEFFKLAQNGTAEKRSEAAATFRSVGSASKGIWVAPASFSETGAWGAQVTLTSTSGASGAVSPRVARLNFDVRPKFSAPGYDEPAPRSASLTDRDVGGDTSHICSNVPPCNLHSVSIADALASGQKPLVVLFATPALCTSATCAPELEAVQQLRAAYAEQANFIHVEIYQYPFDGQHVAKTVDEWHLPSDPWTFVVDRAGTVRDRFEGAAPIDELEPALKAVVA